MKAKPRILMICSSFPPIGGIGVNRSKNLALCLQQFGYKPIIATMTKKDIDRFRFPIDKTLEKEISTLSVERLPSKYLFKLVFFFQKIKVFRIIRYIFFNFFWEREVFWSKNSFNYLKELIEKEEIEIIYTTSSPFSSLLLGKKLKKSTGVKWVADIRDPYTDGYMYKFPSKMHWWIAKHVETQVLKFPDKVIVNNNELKKLYLKRNMVEENQIVLIHNGF